MEHFYVKPGRDDSCPSDSGKKFKKCCFDRHQTNSDKPSISPNRSAPSQGEINQLVALFNAGLYQELEYQTQILLEQQWTALRLRLEESPLMDGNRFTNAIEAVYRQIWQGACNLAKPRSSDNKPGNDCEHI